MSAIRAAAAARKTYRGTAMLPPRIWPSYMRDFFLCEASFWQGAGEKSGAPGEPTPREGPRAQIAVLSGKILQPYGGP